MKMLTNFSYFMRAALSATISVLAALSFVLHNPTRGLPGARTTSSTPTRFALTIISFKTLLEIYTACSTAGPKPNKTTMASRASIWPGCHLSIEPSTWDPR